MILLGLIILSKNIRKVRIIIVNYIKIYIALNEFSNNTNNLLKYQINNNSNINIDDNENKRNQIEQKNNIIFSDNDLHISGYSHYNDKIEKNNVSDINTIDDSQNKKQFIIENNIIIIFVNLLASFLFSFLLYFAFSMNNFFNFIFKIN